VNDFSKLNHDYEACNYVFFRLFFTVPSFISADYDGYNTVLYWISEVSPKAFQGAELRLTPEDASSSLHD
jgi:hypothetical protein